MAAELTKLSTQRKGSLLNEREREMKKYSSSIVSSSSSTSRRNNNNKATPCCSKVGMKRGPWTAEEDELLSTYIKTEGEGRWRTLPTRAGLHRCGKSCRLRWMNYLRPNVKRGHISSDEEDLILRLHRLLGNKWSLIAGRIPGRTDNEIKNYWNTHLSKKLISQGIDPRTHKPFLGNNSSSSSAKVVPNDHINSSNPNLGNDHDQSCCHDQNGNAINFNGDLMNNLHEKEDYINDVDDDDVFSSFLNSLMNEEMFNTQNQQQQEPAANLVVDHDIFISSSQTFVFGPGYMGCSS